MKYLDSTGAEIDTSGLPDDLLAELSCGRDDLSEKILNIIPADGSCISLDQIIVTLYRKHKILKKRRFIQNKLYRMPEIDVAEGRKGVYTINPAICEKLDNNV